MHRVLITALVVLALAGTAAFAQAPSAEDEADVRAALQHYLNGHATGDPEEFRMGFHPDARMTRWVIIAKSFNSGPKSQ